jgi:hypothetical protein
MIFAEIESIDAAGSLMHEREAECRYERVEAAAYEQWVPLLVLDAHSEFDGRRMVVVVAPLNVSEHALGLVIHERIELGLREVSRHRRIRGVRERRVPDRRRSGNVNPLSKTAAASPSA